jgi:hypothetical protein
MADVLRRGRIRLSDMYELRPQYSKMLIMPNKHL